LAEQVGVNAPGSAKIAIFLPACLFDVEGVRADEQPLPRPR
jgi:hypothetical protein